MAAGAVDEWLADARVSGLYLQTGEAPDGWPIDDVSGDTESKEESAEDGCDDTGEPSEHDEANLAAASRPRTAIDGVPVTQELLALLRGIDANQRQILRLLSTTDASDASE